MTDLDDAMRERRIALDAQLAALKALYGPLDLADEPPDVQDYVRETTKGVGE